MLHSCYFLESKITHRALWTLIGQNEETFLQLAALVSIKSTDWLNALDTQPRLPVLV